MVGRLALLFRPHTDYAAAELRNTELFLGANLGGSLIVFYWYTQADRASAPELIGRRRGAGSRLSLALRAGLLNPEYDKICGSQNNADSCHNSCS